MHPGAYNYVARVAPNRPSGLVVEIGSRVVYGGGVRDLFAGSPYVGVDRASGEGVDVVADGSTYQPVERAGVGGVTMPRPVACVVCCEVLEHAENAEAILRNAHAILQTGGLLIVTAAGLGREPHSAVDGAALRAGEFYRNVGGNDLLKWLQAFRDVEITHASGGDAFARTDGDVYARAVK